MNKRDKHFYEQTRLLKHHGWDVTDNYQSNSGSETVKHFIAKCLVAKAVEENGHRWTMEAAHDNRGEIDVLVVPESGDPYAVELETSPTQEVIDDKLSRYVDGTPMRECYVLPVDDMPTDMIEAKAWVQEQLP